MHLLKSQLQLYYFFFYLKCFEVLLQATKFSRHTTYVHIESIFVQVLGSLADLYTYSEYEIINLGCFTVLQFSSKIYRCTQLYNIYIIFQNKCIYDFIYSSILCLFLKNIILIILYANYGYNMCKIDRGWLVAIAQLPILGQQPSTVVKNGLYLIVSSILKHHNPRVIRHQLHPK